MADVSLPLATVREICPFDGGMSPKQSGWRPHDMSWVVSGHPRVEAMAGAAGAAPAGSSPVRSKKSSEKRTFPFENGICC